MRNSTLLTGLIAVIAITLALALTQTDKGKNWFSVYSKPSESDNTQNLIASAVTPPVVQAPSDAAPAAISPNTTASATPAPTAPASDTAPAVTATADTATAAPTATATATATSATDGTPTASMTPVNLDAAQAKLNAETPAAGTEKTDAATPAVTEIPKTTFHPDANAALQDVSIGSATAPITVYDFSSLTCPHCAHFHNDVLPKIKTEYIDKGKVRWVFKGFPLNEPALKGEMIARCAPKDQYIKLEDLMYSNQERWAFSDNPIPNLSMLLKLAGITDDMFLGCVNDKALQDGLLKKIQVDTDKYKLNSTPTFVFNEGEKVINGAGTYEGFAFDLDAMLKAKTAAKSSVMSTPAK